jgi:dienelactone hydrolase
VSRFAGDPTPSTTTTANTEENSGLLEQVKLQVASVAKSFTIDMWLARRPDRAFLRNENDANMKLKGHTPEKVLPLLQKVLTSVKEEFADAVANGGGIYAVGYCFGARYVLLLGSDLDKEAAAGLRSPESTAEEGMAKQGPQIKTGAIAHGTQIGNEDLAGMSVPVSIVAVENDTLFPDDVREEGRKAMEAKKLDHELKIYPNVPHGFAVYGDYDDDKIKQAQGEAFQQMLAWLKAH